MRNDGDSKFHGAVIRPNRNKAPQSTHIDEDEDESPAKAFDASRDREAKPALVSPESQDVEDAAEAKREKAEPVQDFDTLAEQLAHSRICHRNLTLEALEKAFPLRIALHSVELQFPFAEGGTLHVDQPRFEFNIEECREKAVAMRKAGLRYVYLVKDMKLDEALLQLEGKL